MLAHQLFTRFKAAGEPNRAAQMIELLGRMSRPGGGRLKLHVNDRFGASLLYDALLEADEIRKREGKAADFLPTPDDPHSDGDVPVVILPPTALAQLEVSMENQNQAKEMVLEQQAQEWSFPWGVWDSALHDSLFFGESWDPNMNIEYLIQ